MAATDVPGIEKKPGVCGGAARIGDHRIAVWMLVVARKTGSSDADLLADFSQLTAADLDACWEYYLRHPGEIEQLIWKNDTAANVPDGSPPPTAVVIDGLLLGVPEADICRAFEPPLTPAAVAAAWAVYRADPVRVGRDIASFRAAG